MTSGKRRFIFISAAALVLAIIALLFVFAPSALAQEARFTGEPLPATRASGDVTVSYTTHTLEESGSLDEGLPYYTVDYTSVTNACAPLAGSVVLAYYDITFSDLIPGFTAKLFGEYRQPNSAFYDCLNELYSLMHVNEAGPGASESEFDEGLSDYVTDKGYSISYMPAFSGGKIDYTAVKTAINSQRPVLVFALAVDFYGSVSYGTNYASYSWKKSVSNHIFVIEEYQKFVCNKGLPEEYEYVVYYVSDLYTGSRSIVMGDLTVYNAKGVIIS